MKDFTRVKLSHVGDLGKSCVRPCTRVCVRGNECVRGMHAHLRFVHVPPVQLREDEYILLELATRHYGQSTQGCRDNASTCATWLHELKERHCVACHWNSNLRVLHILEVVVSTRALHASDSATKL